MNSKDEIRFLLVRESASLPPDLAIQDQDFLPGWRIMENFDAYALRRRIKASNWNFLQLRGRIEKSVFGRARNQIVRRAVTKILVELRGRKFDSLEITVVVSRCFLGMNLLSISAGLCSFRHDVSAAA